MIVISITIINLITSVFDVIRKILSLKFFDHHDEVKIILTMEQLYVMSSRALIRAKQSQHLQRLLRREKPSSQRHDVVESIRFEVEYVLLFGGDWLDTEVSLQTTNASGVASMCARRYVSLVFEPVCQ